MQKYLFEEITPKLQGIINGFIFARNAKREATLTYDRCKDVVIDNFGGDAEIIFSPESYVQITTACKETTEWRTAFVELARIMAADDAEMKAAVRKATNSVTSTAIRVFEPKPKAMPKKKRG